MSATEDRLAELGITLPEAPPAVAAYVPWVQTGSLVITSGQLPWVEGELSHVGRLGEELADEEGYQAARHALVNALAQVKEAIGDLDRVTRVVRLEGNTHSAPGHRGQPGVLNGASDLLLEIFGDRGRHTRTALGISEMPLGAAVQISLWVEVSDD